MRFPGRIYSIMHAKHSGRLILLPFLPPECTAVNRPECILVGETEVKSYFQSPTRIRTADLLTRFRLARCVSNYAFGCINEHAVPNRGPL